MYNVCSRNSQKNFCGQHNIPNYVDDCLNHDLVVLHEDGKMSLISSVEFTED